MKLSEVMGQPTQPMKLSQVMASPPAAAAPAPAPSVVDEMSTMARLRAGIGQGMVSGAGGALQLAAHNPRVTEALFPGMGVLLRANPEIAGAIDRQIDENAAMDAPLLDTGAGQIGSVVGNMALTAPAGAGAGSIVKGVGAGAKFVRALLSGAEAGAVGGAVQPVAGAGEQSDYADAKGMQMMEGAAGGAAGGAALNRLGAAIERALPSNATATLLNAFNKRANQSDFAAESEALARQTGVNLTPGQVSGSKTQTMAENTARQSIFSRDLAFEGDKARVQQLSDYLDRTLKGITKSEASPTTAGMQMQQAIKTTVANLESRRASQAAADYGELRKITQGSLKIEPDNLRAELSDMLAQHGEMGTGSSDAIAAFARKQLSGGANAGDLDKLLMLRQHLSKVSGGQAKISGDAQDRMIAARMLKAIDDDLELNADRMPGDVGAALKTANANYRAASQQIESVKSGPLKQLLGDDLAGAFESGAFNTIAPEKVMDRLRAMKPTELGVVRGIMEKQQPEAWQVIKRGMLEDAIEKSRAFPASAGANTAVLQPTQLVKNVGEGKRLEAVFSPKELSEINAALGVARRLGDSTGFNFSGTAGQAEALGLMNKLGNISAKTAASTAGWVFGTRSLAKAMTNAEGRATLLAMKRLPPQSERFRELAAKFSAISSAQSDDEP